MNQRKEAKMMMMNPATSRPLNHHHHHQQQQQQQNQFAIQHQHQYPIHNQQQQQQQQHQNQIFHGPKISRSFQNHHHHHPASYIMNSRAGNSQLLLNGKDLIIRMLAEVFQVNQFDDGQVKWQQVSSSLVPISLYSRTTSRWLNFLLAASSSNSMATADTTASAMSPDSRDFLILLQQFHQQQQMDNLINYNQSSNDTTTNNNNNTMNFVVFQVVAHDYCDGQCKKILNVKIAQPGTRLGQASDYFVYWKEQRPNKNNNNLHQHHHHPPPHPQVPFPQTSSASNNNNNNNGKQQQQFCRAAGNSMGQTPKSGRQSSLSRNHFNQQQNSITQHQTPICCQIPIDIQQQQPQQHYQQTWGLNFASVNDAKLFYDICSLNLVDLNFNSEYLKQLASSSTANDMRPRDLLAAEAAISSNRQNSVFTSTMQQQQEQQLANNNPENQKLIRDFLNYKQKRSNQSISGNNNNKAKQMQQQERQLSTSSIKCQSCKQMLLQQQQQQQQHSIPKQQSKSLMDADSVDRNCPIHSQASIGFNEGSFNQSATSSMRLRSRSSTRHQDLASEVPTTIDLKGTKRTRSFSTPASPERIDQEFSETPAGAGCPVHSSNSVGRRTRHQSYNHQQESSTDCERPEAHHHPRCLSFMKQQQQQQQQQLRSNRIRKQQPQQQQVQPQDLGTLNRPRKPMRGVMRDSSSRSGDFVAGPPPPPVRQSSSSSNKVRPTENKIGSHHEHEDSIRCNPLKGQEVDPEAQTEVSYEQQDRHMAARFASSRASQRRSTTAVDRSTVGNLHGKYEDDNSNDPSASSLTAHRDASQARARYANSRNMKEFLSLDAGGQQQQQSTTPVQFAAQLNERFQQQQQQQQLATKTDTLRQSERQLSKQTDPNNRNSKLNKVSSLSNHHIDSRLVQSHELVTSNVSPIEDEVRNASTTTEDLPLDPNTRRRMFKLTSEEVISERTEPKSLSTPSVVPVGMQQQQQQQEQRDDLGYGDRHLRAVSLGPDVEQELRKSQRSLAGRRRSLERTTCVDLVDNGCSNSGINQQTPTYLKKTAYRLSPIDSSNGTRQQRHPIATKTASFSITTPLKRQRTRSSGAADRRHLIMRHEDCCLLDSTGNNWQNLATQPETMDNIMHNSVFAPSGVYNQYDPQRLLSFKSVPDFSQIHHHHHQVCHGDNYHHHCDQQAIHHLQDWEHPVIDHGLDSDVRHLQKLSGSAPRTKANTLSSYAVPLCPEVGDQWTPSYGLQSRSCPNSLRRKRKDHNQQQQHQQLYNLTYQHQYPHQYHHQRQPQHQQQMHPLGFYQGDDIVSSQQQEMDPINPVHRCFTCPMEPRVGGSGQMAGICGGCNGSLRGCSVCMMTAGANLAGCASRQTGYSVRSKPLSSEHHCQQQQRSRGSNEQQRRTDLHWRPCSSQSSKSPLHYGLYESDCEDNEPREMDTCVSGAARLPATFGLEDSYLDRSVSAYFRPTTAAQVDASMSGQLKPVQGYDQTMARTALKSRQRARSQPPDETVAAIAETEDAIRLEKSMENVQKLIKEVQNELILMRSGSGMGNNSNASKDRWPGAGVGGIGSGAYSKEERQTMEPGREIKMSNEEQQSNSKHKQHPAGNQSFQTISQQQASTTTTAAPISATSATRRAGQFKCVGAIRKAGFLSVKKWILKRRQSIELARKQGWKRYWVCLRGTALLFHSVIDKRICTDDNENDETVGSTKDCIDLLAWIKANCCAGGQKQLLSSLMAQQQQQQQQANSSSSNSGNDMNEFLKNMAQCYIESEPRHLIIIEGAIVQPIPEHPKRDHVFCLSTTFGDAYLFQATCQLESDNWISAIHNACAASLARDLTRDEAMKLFEAKVRHLELEAEKKLFLRQRLESRLTTMNSIGGIGTMGNTTGNINSTSNDNSQKNVETSFSDNKKATLRSLLYRLAQQLVALDNYLEQVHCEIYQLRCYLYSCGAQHQFYQNLIEAARTSGGNSSSTPAPTITSIELPHPKSLLMHVCRQTKLFLIKLGVFTVSSFHAYLHARQGSADSILQSIQQQQQQTDNQQQATNLSFELRSRALSISEKLLSHVNQELETNTEELIHLSNLRSISIHLTKSLLKSIRQISPSGNENENQLPLMGCDTEDGHSIRDIGETVIINLKVHLSSSSASIIKQVLKILQDNRQQKSICQSELNYLNYYLRFETTSGKDIVANGNDKRGTTTTKKDCCVIAKRRETLNDWQEFEYLELMEKIIFRVQLSRKRLDEEASPFGIAIGAQLILGQLESQLNVYCSYIEWGSVADKAGLRDDDELLIINGIPVMDLDMMFVECILQDEQSLKLVVRSCRLESPANSDLLDRFNYWRPTDGGGHARDNSDGKPETSGGKGDTHMQHGAAGSQVISDEYISSLVCPPPPAKSSAFLRLPETTLLRQKSDMGGSNTNANTAKETHCQQNSVDRQTSGLVVSQTSPALAADEHNQQLLHITKSQQDLSLDSSLNLVDDDDNGQEIVVDQRVVNAEQLAGQLLRKTGHITRLLMGDSSEWNNHNNRKSEITSAVNNNENKSKKETSSEQVSETHEESANDESTGEIAPSQMQIFADPNSIERLRKSILELLETEYAYIRHLETISEHYMVPLEETSYLNISDLRLLSQTVIDLIAFQRDFFDKMTGSVWAKCELNEHLLASSNSNNNNKMIATDESEELNKIVQQLELFETIDHFKPLILSLAKTFISEADRFKIYAAYCVAYSRLQKFLHPKRSSSNSSSVGFNNTGFSSISTIPTALDTFLTSSGAGISTPNLLTGSTQPREFFKPLGSFMANNSGISILQNYNNNNNSNNNNQNSNQNVEFGAKLRQLSEFLGNLDSSSSSASLSLPKSSNSDLTPHSVQVEQSQSNSISIGKRSPKGAGSGSPMPPFQKSAHQQNFESYLIKPIQRIVKYPMLLNSIAASAQIYKDEELDSELQIAIKQMGSTTSYVNDAQKIHDEYGQVFEQIERQFTANQPQQIGNELTNSLSRSSGQFTTNSSTAATSGVGLPHQPPISLAIEQLLYFGPVSWLNINEFTQNSKLKNGINLSYMLFVFESCVIFICKEKIVTRGNSGNKKKFSTNLATTTTTTTSNVINQGNSANNPIESSNLTSIGSSLTSASNKAFTHQKPTNNSFNNTTDQASSYIIRYQSLIPVSEVQVRSVPTTTTISTSTNQFQWELFRCSSVNSNSSLLTKSNKRQGADKNNSNNNTGKVYLLSSATNEIRNAFLRKIRFIIRESVRNMSLPLARSPSSKSLTPKKMSSPSLATNTNSSCSTSLSPVCNSGENCHKRQQEMSKQHETESGLATGGTEPEFVATNQVVCDNNKLYKTSIEVNN